MIYIQYIIFQLYPKTTYTHRQQCKVKYTQNGNSIRKLQTNIKCITSHNYKKKEEKKKSWILKINTYTNINKHSCHQKCVSPPQMISRSYQTRCIYRYIQLCDSPLQIIEHTHHWLIIFILLIIHYYQQKGL